MADVTWMPVPDYEGMYEVSDAGQVRSLDRIIENRSGRRYSWRGRMLKPIPDGRLGYLRVKLCSDGLIACTGIHIIVARAFFGPRPDGMQVCHNNGYPADNRLVNLRYDTPSENALDTVDHGTCYQSRKDECPSGHPYNEANTRFVKTPFGNGIGRQCRICDKAKAQANRDKDRAAYNADARERRRRKKQAA